MKSFTTCALVAAAGLFAATSANAALVVAADYTFDGGTPAGGVLNGDANIAGGSLNLDGDGDYLSFAATPLTATDNFAIETTLTINAGGSGGFSFPVYNSTAGNTGGVAIVEIGLNIDGFRPNSGGNVGLGTGVLATPATLTYSLVRQGGVYSVYINGVSQGPGASSMADAPTVLNIGAGFGGGGAAEGFFNGSIDRVRLSTFGETDTIGVDGDGYITAVPEPGSLALLGLGGLLIVRRRRA